MKEARGLTNVFPRTFFLFQTDLIMNYCLLAKLKPDLCTIGIFSSYILREIQVEKSSGRTSSGTAKVREKDIYRSIPNGFSSKLLRVDKNWAAVAPSTIR